MHRSWVELGNDCWFNTDPLYPPTGELEARFAIRERFDRCPDAPDRETVIALSELRAFEDDELWSVVGRGSQTVRTGALTALSRPMGRVDIPYLAMLAESAASVDVPVRVAALRGLARMLEYERGGVHVLHALESLLDRIADRDEDPGLRAEALRVAGLHLSSYGSGNHARFEVWRHALQELATEVFVTSVGRDGYTALRREAGEVILRVTAHTPPPTSPDLVLLEELFWAAIRDAPDADVAGEALVKLARFHAIPAVLEERDAAQRRGDLIRQLIRAVREAPLVDSAWAALALAHVVRDMVPYDALPPDAAPALFDVVERAAAAGDLAAYLPALAVVGFDCKEPLLDWVKMEEDPATRGLRLMQAIQVEARFGRREIEEIASGFERDPAFLTVAAPGLAIHMEPDRSHGVLLGAVQLALDGRWSDAELVPLVDALGMAPTDPAVGVLLRVLEEKPHESMPARRAGLSLGRIFEVGRHSFKGHPFRLELYR